MDKLSKLMMARVQKLQSYLQNLLEAESLEPLSDKKSEPKKHFEIQSDLSQIDELGVGLPQALNERTKMLFSRMSVYFEAGMLFKKNNSGHWNPSSAFQEGEFYPLIAEDLKLEFAFPQMTLVEIQRLKKNPLYTKLEEIGLVKTKDTQVLIFKPHPDYVFLVTSLLPDLWLKPHSEKIQQQILMLLGDY